jgi:hypothetical protein
MFRPRTLLFTLAALSTALVAEDFGPVVKVAGLAFPGRNHFGVVCNYGRSQKVVSDLVRALPEGSILTVVDVCDPSQIDAAGSAVLHHGVQLLALLPGDTLVRDGSPFATSLVNRFSSTIPAFGTTPAAIQNGCAFALGRGTNWKLLVNPGDPRVKGVIEDIKIEEEVMPFGAPTTGRLGPTNVHVVSIASR